MKTLEQAAEAQGITLRNGRLSLHFSSIPNWYGCILGFDCPRCDTHITWEWEGKMSGFTNEKTVAHLKPKVTNAELIGFGHRWIQLRCDRCHTYLMADNFD